MGCDFYVYYKIYIQYKRGDKVEVVEEEEEDTRERCYWWDCVRDRDFEELIDYHERAARQRREQIDNELRNYPKKELFKDGRWRVIESAQEYYKDIVRKHNIAENELVLVWKAGDFHLR